MDTFLLGYIYIYIHLYIYIDITQHFEQENLYV